MKKEFVLRGQTGSGKTETLNFSGHKSGYAYRLTEFQLYPSTALGTDNPVLVGSITAGKTAIAPTDPNFNDEALIATATVNYDAGTKDGGIALSVINDTFMVTQNLILMVVNSQSGEPVNWQCRFESVKMSGPEEAVTNYKQFMISDGS